MVFDIPSHKAFNYYKRSCQLAVAAVN